MRPVIAPWNQAQVQATALPFWMFSQMSSRPMGFMKPPIKVAAVRGTASPVTGSKPSTAQSRSSPRTPCARRAMGSRMAYWISVTRPPTSPRTSVVVTTNLSYSEWIFHKNC